MMMLECNIVDVSLYSERKVRIIYTQRNQQIF